MDSATCNVGNSVACISVDENECTTSSCKYSELLTDFEGLKLDMVITESKLGKEIYSNTQTINSVRDELIKLQRSHDDITQQVNHSPNHLVNTAETIVRLKKENKQLLDKLKALKLNLEADKKGISDLEIVMQYRLLHRSHSRARRNKRQ